MSAPLRIAISACLVGERVRYDGGEKKDDALLAILGPHAEFLRICPEVEAGMGTPREPVKLVRNSAVRIVGIDSGRDWTDEVLEVSSRRIADIVASRIDGSIFKSRSPSCGIGDASEFDLDGEAIASDGLFASAVRAALPLLPAETEERLADPVVLQNFVEAMFAHRGLAKFFSGHRTVGELVMFHSQRKLQLLSHSSERLRDLNATVAAARSDTFEDVARHYQSVFMETIQLPSPRSGHAEALEQVATVAKRYASLEETTDLEGKIADYLENGVPLAVPHEAARRLVRKYDIAHFEFETYLYPSASEIALRNLSIRKDL